MHMAVRTVSTSPRYEEPLTLKDLIRVLIKNPSEITKSIDLSNKIIDILIDSISNNDMVYWMVSKKNSVREIINRF